MSHSRQLARDADRRSYTHQAQESTYKELRHRGEPLVVYPGAELGKALGGSDGVAVLIQDLYRRIEQDELLGVAFPHFNSAAATPFFIQWFLGGRGYSGVTPLLHLTKTRSKDDPIPVMELLAAGGAGLDARDEDDGTLLMYFARQGKAEPVQLLLSHGADPSARNKSGKTAAQLGRAHARIVPHPIRLAACGGTQCPFIDHLAVQASAGDGTDPFAFGRDALGQFQFQGRRHVGTVRSHRRSGSSGDRNRERAPEL
jgi:hypothetical protein